MPGFAPSASKLANGTSSSVRCEAPALTGSTTAATSPPATARRFLPCTPSPTMITLMIAPSDGQPGVDRVLTEHTDGLERVRRQVLADEGQLAQEVARDGDDLAADRIRLEHVEQLARAGPDQLRGRLGFEDLNRDRKSK